MLDIMKEQALTYSLIKLNVLIVVIILVEKQELKMVKNIITINVLIVRLI